MRPSALVIVVLASGCALPPAPLAEVDRSPLFGSPRPVAAAEEPARPRTEPDAATPTLQRLDLTDLERVSAQDPRRNLLTNHGILNLSLGSRMFEDARWGSLDDQFAVGLDFTFKSPDSPIGLNIGVSGSGNRERVAGVDVDAWQGELTVGPRGYLMMGDLPFYFYGGISAALVYSELEVITGGRTSDTQFGGIANVGMMFRLNRGQGLGIEWRALQGTDFSSPLDGVPDDADYHQVSLTFSAAF